MIGPRDLRALLRDRSGVALIEFAFIFPMMMFVALAGTELTNYVITRMRVSQLALHIADNAARMGSGSMLTMRQITETDINDLFVGANLQASTLNLQANGRVIVSDLQPESPGATRYKIGWQRCYGAKVHPSSYGAAGATGMTGMGPAGNQVIAMDNIPTMFVEVYYVYQPLVAAGWSPSGAIVEIASAAVRDRRDTTRVYNPTSAPVSSC